MRSHRIPELQHESRNSWFTYQRRPSRATLLPGGEFNNTARTPVRASGPAGTSPRETPPAREETGAGIPDSDGVLPSLATVGSDGDETIARSPPAFPHPEKQRDRRRTITISWFRHLTGRSIPSTFSTS